MRDQPGLLISGTRKGIGRALAEHYLDRGFRVIGCSRRPSELQREGYEHHCLDVRDEIAVRLLMKQVREGPGSLLGLILRQGIWAIGAGLTIGLLGAFALTRLLSAMLFQVGALDAAAITSASAVLAGVSLAACYIPARRATQVDPAVALRYE